MILTFTIVSSVIFLGMLFYIPFRIKSLKKQSGKLLMPLKAETPFRSIAIILVSAVLLVIVPLRNFAPYIAAIFDAVALLATYLSCMQIANCKINGIYEKMIIVDTNAILFENIYSLPTVAYEKDEDTTQVDFRLLEVMPKKGGKIQLIFPDEQIRNQALDIILQQCPRLKA